MSEGDPRSTGAEQVLSVSSPSGSSVPSGQPIVRPHASSSRTELGRRLRELRRRVVESGTRLLDWEELETELSARRGDRSEQ